MAPDRPRPSEAGISARWNREAAGNPVAAARRWVRRTVPELVRRSVRDDLAADLDLVVSELCGNALRHTGAVGDVVLEADRRPSASWSRTRTTATRTCGTPTATGRSGVG